MSAAYYANSALANTASMLQEVTTNPDGTTRGMPSELTAGVLVAQSNLAIAAALMLIAENLGARS